MNNLAILFNRQEITARWRAERENASARYELAKIKENSAYLLSQHEPVASLEIDRDRLQLVLSYIQHGDINRLNRDFEELRVKQARL